MTVAVHQVDLGGAPEVTSHVLELSAMLAADGCAVTIHGPHADVSLAESLTACTWCVERPGKRSLAAVLAHLATRIPKSTVVHVHGSAGRERAAFATLAVLRGRPGRRLVYSPHRWAPASDLAWRLSVADAVVCDSQEETAMCGSLGAEAWHSPLVPPPSPVLIGNWRREWGAAGDDRVVLAVGDRQEGMVARLASGAASRPGDGILAIAGPDPGGWRDTVETVSAAGARCRARVLQIASADLLPALAAADVAVLPAGHAHSEAVAAYARQFATPVVLASDDTDLGAAVDASRSPDAAARRLPDAASVADLHRRAYARPQPAAVEDPRRVAVVAWTASRGRTEELAAGLGGEGRTFYDLNITSRRLIPLRYALSAARTMAYLARSRPRAVVISNPPIVLPVVGFAYARVARIPMLLDSQTKSFGQKGSRLGRAMLPVHRWISRGSTCTLVGADELGDRVRQWGGRAEVFHEAPPVWRVGPTRPPGPIPRVLWVGVLAGDEPLDALLEAATRLPHVEFRVTGDLRRAPDGWESAPANVTWLGFVRGSAYPREIERTDLVITMTTDPTSALRGAAEAVFARRPLLTSDWPFLRELFPYAIHAANDADGIAAGVGAALAHLDELHAAADDALDLHLSRWSGQLARLRALIEPAHDELDHGLGSARSNPLPVDQVA